MIPLRLELSEKTALRVQEAPQAVKDEIEERHNHLSDQVRRSYIEKQKELEDYADLKLDDYEASEARQEESKEQVVHSSPRIKSIVKRSPSNGEKRVSFSRSPPKVELFKKDYFEEEDDSGDEHRPPVTAPNGEAVNFRSQRSGPYYPFPRPSSNGNDAASISSKVAPVSFSLSNSSPSYSYLESEDAKNSAVASSEEDSPSQDQSASPEPRSKIAEKSKTETPSRVSSEASSTSPLLHSTLESSTTAPPHDDTLTSDSRNGESHEEMFPFEDIPEPPAAETDETTDVNDHHARFDEPDTKINDTLPEPAPIYTEPSIDQFTVGSAPIDIASRPRRLEGDGGPAARSEADRLQQESEEVDLGGSLSLSNLPDSDNIDPSQMSFSQRMEWENLKKAQHNKR